VLKQILWTFLAVAGVASAQTYYAGVVGGYALGPDLTITNGTSKASVGLKGSGVLGALGGGDTAKYWGGEVRYMVQFSDLKLASGGTEVDFSSKTHTVTGDILGYFTPRDSAVRPYFSFGGGVRVLVGTGQESAAQPLSNFAALTATRETLAVGDFGVGLKMRLSRAVHLRLEVRDYIGQAPSKVIAPNTGSKMSGVLNDVVAVAILSYDW